jgi:hypothetical protein
MNDRRIATFTGWLWIITFVTSIPARLFFYAPVLDHEGSYITGAGSDARTLIGIGAVLELLLIISNVGTAVVLGVIPAEGPAQVLVAPEFIWELGIGIYLIVKGYRTSSPALAGTQDAAAV